MSAQGPRLAFSRDAGETTAVRLEIHEHCFVSGRRANGPYHKFEHCHPGGDVPHQHPDTGPASYTIDKDDWARMTGLSGGGRKKFSARPKGEQLPIVALERSQSEFEIIVCPPPEHYKGDGPGLALPARMVLAFGMKAIVRGEAPPRRGRSS